MARFDKMDRRLGSVIAVSGPETVVGTTDERTVLVLVHPFVAAEEVRRTDYPPGDALELATLLEDAAGLAGTLLDDDARVVGDVRTSVDGATIVRVHRPTVSTTTHHWRGDLLVGIEYTPREARTLAELLREAANVIHST